MSFLFCFSKYRGFNTNYKLGVFGLCLGWFSLTVYFFALNDAIQKMFSTQNFIYGKVYDDIVRHNIEENQFELFNNDTNEFSVVQGFTTEQISLIFKPFV